MGKKRKSAFTLIELLVVIGIIMILASILTPGLLKAKKKATQVACLANVKAIGSAMMLYADDYNNVFPWDNTNTSVAFGLMFDLEDFTEMGVFKCPQSRTLAPTAPAANHEPLICLLASRQSIDYRIVSASFGGAYVAPTTSDPSSNLLLVEEYSKGDNTVGWDAGDNHSNGGNCYFINGSAKFIKNAPQDNKPADTTAPYDITPDNIAIPCVPS